MVVEKVVDDTRWCGVARRATMRAWREIYTLAAEAWMDGCDADAWWLDSIMRTKERRTCSIHKPKPKLKFPFVKKIPARLI
jgi:hypothetical protein